MADEITAFQEEVDIVGCATLSVVGGGHPSRIFGRTPVQLRCHFAAVFGNCGFDLGVDLGPFERWVGLLVCAIIGECVQVVVICWRGSFWWQDDTVRSEVVNEGRSETDSAGLGDKTAVSARVYSD